MCRTDCETRVCLIQTFVSKLQQKLCRLPPDAASFVKSTQQVNDFVRIVRGRLLLLPLLLSVGASHTIICFPVGEQIYPYNHEKELTKLTC